jgi:hypothetical protein
MWQTRSSRFVWTVGCGHDGDASRPIELGLTPIEASGVMGPKEKLQAMAR